MVTWEKTSEKQAGVLARAKAAIVEKQEGWGTPVVCIHKCMFYNCFSFKYEY